MAWIEPQYSRGEIDRAGEWMVSHIGQPTFDLAAFDHHYNVIGNWRSAHAYPLQIIKMTLKKRARNIYDHALVAQRLKRFPSVYIKLRRNAHMKLSQMQDLGGCRAVLPSVGDVERLVDLYQTGDAKNPHGGRPQLVKPYDYIVEPKKDGYRGVHLVYKYQTESPARKMFNGQRIEIQIRSRLQHAWATAVETVDIATDQALKSNLGKKSWKRFFALMGSAIALRERRPLVPNTPKTRDDLAAELRTLSRELKVETILTGISAALERSTVGEEATDGAYLLVLDAAERHVSITGFARTDMAAAQEAYADVERQLKDKSEQQAVLVSVDSLDNLATAFPNFFLDTSAFLDALKFTLGERPVRRIIRPARF
jgi:ppGpp synthetase/RelA/SpoT-type nucleotidyltranferase